MHTVNNGPGLPIVSSEILVDFRIVAVKPLHPSRNSERPCSRGTIDISWSSESNTSIGLIVKAEHVMDSTGLPEIHWDKLL